MTDNNEKRIQRASALLGKDVTNMAVMKVMDELLSLAEQLQEDSDFLSYLESCGVDNWHGYHEAQQMKREEEDI